MGQKLSSRESELYKRCDEVLHYLWDPIGVAGAPGARDEYDSYLPQVFGLVRDQADPEKVATYLLTIQKGSMGLDGDPVRTRRTVEVLREWREWIWERAP